jgi:hypothetical protein
LGGWIVKPLRRRGLLLRRHALGGWSLCASCQDTRRDCGCQPCLTEPIPLFTPHPKLPLLSGSRFRLPARWGWWSIVSIICAAVLP